MAPASYWLVSLPLDSKRKDAAWELLQEKTQSMSVNSKFEIPELRIGTLDTLMHLSDDLSKTSSLVEVVVNKLRRQVHELGGPVSASQLRVKGLAPDTYITRFKWNEAKYQAKRPLRELVDLITESVGRIEDDLKVIHSIRRWNRNP
jgi:V-type H+-transporting ATPase subunit C